VSKAGCAENLARLREDLGTQLVIPERVTPPDGLSTGWPMLDRYLLWHGFPKGALSLLISESGGATSLWQKSAAVITEKKQWVAWMNGPESDLSPWALRARGVDLSRVLCVSSPADTKQTLWALQELMSLCLFEMIGCDLGGQTLREHQVLKLKKLAMRYQTAIVLITRSMQISRSSFYSLVLHFQKKQVIVNRALHRQTPHALERRDLYADTLPQLAARRLPYF
jgi:hypothetical protein